MARTEFAITASRSEQTAEWKKAGKGLILVDQTVGLQLDRDRDSGSDSASNNDNFIALAPGQCPIAAISQRLAGAPCDSLHLVGHGAPGQVALGSGLNRQVLLEHAEAIQQWGVQRIVLWSCNTAQDHSFIALLQQLSNAEVIASAAPLGQGATLSATGEPALEQAIAALVYPLGIIESTGNTTLTLGEDNRYYAFGHKLGYAWGSDYYPGNWESERYPGGFEAIGAESIVSPNGWNKVLWRPVAGQSTDVVITSVDNLGKEMYSGYNGTKMGPHFVYSGADRGEYNYLEGAFGLDLDGNGNIGNTMAYNASDARTIESNGNTSLSLFNGNYYAFGSKIVDGLGSDLYPGKFAGGAGAPNGWEAIAAERIDGANHLLLRPVGEQSSWNSHWLSHWTIGNAGATSVELNREDNPQDYAALEVAYNEDLDRNGMVGLNQPPVATAGEYATQENQSVALNLANLATDSNHDVLTFSSASGPLKGTVSLGSDGNGTYTPTGFDSLPAGSQATDSFVYSVTDGKSAAVTNSVNLTITGVNDNATITANSLPAGSIAQNASNISVLETAIPGGTAVADAFSIADVDYGEQEFNAVTKTVAITADGKGAYQGADAANRVVGSFSLDSSAATNSVAAGATTGTTADLTITDNGVLNGAANGFDSLAAGETATASITLTSEDGTATSTSNLTITGVNDTATITANSVFVGSINQNASNISVSETAITGGTAVANAFSIADVDYGQQEFGSGNYSTSITADGKGAYQGAGAVKRVVGSFSLDSSDANNSVARSGTTANLTITDNGVQNGAANGFASLAEGETAKASITLTSEDGTATSVSNLTITGVNDTATITANSLPSTSPTQNASNILFSESAITGGKAAADAFSISDVDYGEQEFKVASQSIEIIADGKGAYQGADAAIRVVGSFALDSSAATNSVAPGAVTGTTADLTITDNGVLKGAVNGFASLAAGETAKASIILTSEDGTATSTSNLTITGVNDNATITATPYETSYTQSDFSSTPVITHSDVYRVADVDYGQQEFSSGNYNTSITVDSGSGRSGEVVGGFAIVSDGSNRSGGSVHRDPGSQNGDSADVVISNDLASPAGRVFNLAAVLDGDPNNNYGVHLNNAINGGKGADGLYDLSDFSVSAGSHGLVEVYRYQTDSEGGIIGGAWSSSDRLALSATDPLRLIGGINSLAYGETASATLAGPKSEDRTGSTAATTITIAGQNDAPIVDTGKQLKSFELYGTFTVAEMLGFVDPSKTLITDVDYGSMPESIAVSKLTPTGNFADADTGTLQRYNEATKEWDDIDTKNVSETNKLLLHPNDLLRFNANAEAYVSAALGGGSNSGGGIFNVEFRAWDSAYAAELASDHATPDSTLFSGGLQTITLALATSGERANATDLTYIPGQAIGIDGSNITVDGELTIQTPVKGSVSGAGSSVNDNAVALVDGTSFGGIHGVGSANNITAAGNTVINAQAEGLVSVDASNYFDSFDDAVDADATARLGIKSGPVGSGLVANGAYGVRDVDLEVGANLDLTGIVLGQTLATSRSTDGRAHAGSQFASSAGIANTTADVAGAMDLTAEGGILTTVEAFSRNGSAVSDSTAAAAYGVVSGLKGTETSLDVGGALNADVGLNITMTTKATMVGDGVDNNNGFSFDDEVVADTKIGKSFGLGTLDPHLRDLAIDVKDTLGLDIHNTALLDSLATAVSGDVTAKGQMAGNTGIYHADLQAGGAGSMDVSIKSRVNSLADTTTGDGLASAYSLHSVGIEASDFAFQDPHSSLSIDVDNGSSARALTKHGSAISHLGSSSAGMLGDAATDFVRSVESVNALVNDHGFSQAAGISGTGAVATADQSALGVSGYAFSTTSAMTMEVATSVDSLSHAEIVQWG